MKYPRAIHFFKLSLLLWTILSCRIPFTGNDSMPLLQTPNGEVLEVRMAVSTQDQTKGLSGLKNDQFRADEAMLFFYDFSDYRRFWMPDTYFNLDIFFLDENLKVLYVARKVPAHPGMDTSTPIATTETVYCRHVLELRADSALSQTLKVGDQLSWKRPPRDWKTSPKTHHQQ